MNDAKMAIARMAIEQLSRKERQTLVRDLGILAPETAKPVALDVRLLRRQEVARRLSVSPRTVDNWSREGLLSKKKMPGRKRSCGFSSLDVEKLIISGTYSG